ncbi:MAG: PSD1 and planctomycete cytochrome C domain-containing protein [Gemmataceae bacterium]|nr:PSD1 and planctomycete cytochrome C domain-containing protein [Gemmataceae bacterium]
MVMLLAISLFSMSAREVGAADKIDFAREVLPILSDNCFQCHGPDAAARKGDLRLDTREGALRKEDPVIVPGKSGASSLLQRVTSSKKSEMMPPPKSNKKLTPAQIGTLQRWVDQGAAWGKHWAFEKPERQPLPAVRNQAWPRNGIDAFVLARLEKAELAPSPEADRVKLLRRVTLDLTGLPPTPAEVDAFLKDGSQDAYEKAVDRLLASPRFGERMVWEWLDAARYADSNGYQGDGERTMWPWRDWAIRAFNDNMPFDRFTVAQLAGDLLPNATHEQKLATAFLRNHMINGEGGRIAEENRVDYVMDMAETTGTVWLGLTMTCCRCHDHKFDSLAQKEYYGLFAVFNQTPVTGGGGDPQSKPVLEQMSDKDRAELAGVQKQIDDAGTELDKLEESLFPRAQGKPIDDSPRAKDLPKEIKDVLKQPAGKRNKNQLALLEKHFAGKEVAYVDQLKALNRLVGARDDVNRRIVRVMVMEDMLKPRDTFILDKGLYNKPKAKVPAGVPAVLPPLPADAPLNRLTLARWIASADNPLTARVIVNRFWQQFLGIGLVKTVDDFGVQGERPPHQELLDWLALDFVDSGWDVKKLCRRIVTSATYRQSSRVTPALAELDPENRLLARGARHRLPSWMIRDQALAASGLLVDKIGGPSVKPYQPAGIWEEATFGNKRYQQDKGEALYRRSVYTFWRRIVGPTMFFDTAARQTCTVKQTRTNTPLHALTTLNDVQFVEAARVLAERVLMMADVTDDQRIEHAFRFVLARKPDEQELPILRTGLKRLRGQYSVDPAAAKKLLAVGESKRNEKLDVTEHAAFTGLCNLILNLDEALTKE